MREFKIYNELDSPSKRGVFKICDEPESPNGLRHPQPALRFLKPCKVASKLLA